MLIRWCRLALHIQREKAREKRKAICQGNVCNCGSEFFNKQGLSKHLGVFLRKHLDNQPGLKDSTMNFAQGAPGNHQAPEISAPSMLNHNGLQVSGDHDEVGTTASSLELGSSNIGRRVMDGQERSSTDSLKRKFVRERNSAITE